MQPGEPLPRQVDRSRPSAAGDARCRHHSWRGRFTSWSGPQSQRYSLMCSSICPCSVSAPSKGRRLGALREFVVIRPGAARRLRRSCRQGGIADRHRERQQPAGAADRAAAVGSATLTGVMTSRARRFQRLSTTTLTVVRLHWLTVHYVRKASPKHDVEI